MNVSDGIFHGKEQRQPMDDTGRGRGRAQQERQRRSDARLSHRDCCTDKAQANPEKKGETDTEEEVD